MASNPMGLFSKVPANNIDYSKFDKSNVVRYSIPSCRIVPFSVLETTPGERMRIKQSHFIRTAPLVNPAMQDVNFRTYWFCVPKRIIDDQFEQWYTRGPKGTISISKPVMDFRYLSGLVPDDSFKNLFLVPFPAVQSAMFGASTPRNALLPDLLLPYLGYPVVTGMVNNGGALLFSTDKNMSSSNSILEAQLTAYINNPSFRRFIVHVNDFTDGSDQSVDDPFGDGYRLFDPSLGFDEHWAYYNNPSLFDMYRWFAYWLIYDEYFRNQKLTEPIFRDHTTGVRKHIRDFMYDNKKGLGWIFDTEALKAAFRDVHLNPLDLAYAYYDSDYITSAMPSPTLGEEVHIPMQLVTLDSFGNDSPLSLYRASGSTVQGAYLSATAIPSSGVYRGDILNSATINDLKKAYALQRWQDISARFNNRYDDVLYGHFGVRTSDKSLQRPQYLGGGSIPLRISEVVNTTANEFAPLGEMAGRAIASGHMPDIEVYTEEPSIIIGLCTVTPEPHYFEGVDRLLQVYDSLDEYSPEFQHIGLDSVKRSEVNFYRANVYDSNIFGYQTRFARYKFEPDRIKGLFLTDFFDWTAVRSNIDPVLEPRNVQFARPHDLNRLFVDTSDLAHNFLVESYLNIDDLQKMDFYSRTY